MDYTFRSPKYAEYFIYSADFLSLTLVPTDFQSATLRMSPDVPFKINATTFTATDSRLSVKMKGYDSGRDLQDNPSDIRNIAGRPLPQGAVGSTTINPNNGEFLPYMWSTPFFLKPSSTFNVEMANLSGVANVARMSFHGGKVQIGNAPWLGSYKSRYPYTTSVDFGTIAANGNASGTITTGKDGDYLITNICLTRTGQGTIFVSESSRGRDWMDKAVHLDNFAGPAYAPNNLLVKSPRFLLGGSALNINVTNLESAVTNAVKLTLSGYKLFK